MKPDYSVSELVPHAGKMSLLDDIVDCGHEWLHAEVNITAESMFANHHGVPSWVGLEYMAQAISAYAGLQERRSGGKPKIGFLLGTRMYHCNQDYFTINQTLLVKVQVEMIGGNGLNVFNCELEGKGLLATAVVNVFQPDDAEEFLQDTQS